MGVKNAPIKAEGAADAAQSQVYATPAITCCSLPGTVRDRRIRFVFGRINYSIIWRGASYKGNVEAVVALLVLGGDNLMCQFVAWALPVLLMALL